MKKLFLFLLIFSAFSLQAQLAPRTDLNYARFLKVPPTGSTSDDILMFHDGPGIEDYMYKISTSSIITPSDWTKTGNDIRNNNIGHVQVQLQTAKKFEIYNSSNVRTGFWDEYGDVSGRSMIATNFFGNGGGLPFITKTSTIAPYGKWEVSPMYYTADHSSDTNPLRLVALSELTAVSGGFIPYTGATSDVDLGGNNINAFSYDANGHRIASEDGGLVSYGGNLTVKNPTNTFGVQYDAANISANRTRTLANASGNEVLKVQGQTANTSGEIDLTAAINSVIASSGVLYSDNRNGDTLEMANNSITGVSSLNVVGTGTFGGAVTALNFSGSSSGTNTGDNAANTNTGLVHTTGAETIAGVKTFSSTIVGSVNGNAATVTTNANLSGDVTSSGNTTTYNNVVPANKGGAGSVSGILKANGSGTVTAAVAADFPTLNQNTTGNAATVTTNANLTGPITSSGNATSVAAQTGTGSTFVMQASPTLTTPNIGTPTAGTLTSCTGLPISTGVSGLATGVATFLGTSSSANLVAALTDETGSGAAVFGTSPTISAPTISGVATFSTNNFVITGGLTANIILGTGASQSGNTFVQGRTIGTDATAGSTAVITPTNTMNSAPFQLQNQISSMTAYTAKTTTYTATASDFMIDCTSGTFTVTLPTAVGITGKRYCVKNSGAGTITLATTSSQTIDGVTTKTINVQYSNYQIISDGANWKVISAL